MELVCFLPCTFASLGFEEEDTGEQGYISSRHLLTCEHHTAIYISGLSPFPVGTAFGSTGIVIDALQEINMLMAERVLVFIEMNEHVTDLCTLVTHGIVGRAFQIADLRVTLEKAYDGYGKLIFRRSG